MSRRWWWIVAALALFGMSRATPVYAADDSFMMRSELPADNAVGAQAGYFDLKAGKTRRTIGIRLFNPGAKRLAVRVRLLQGTTERNGGLGYHPVATALRREFHFPATVSLAPKRLTQLQLTLPDRATIGAGTKLLAIELTSMPKTTQTVVSRVQYRVGLVLRGRRLAHRRGVALVAISPRVKLGRPRLWLTLANRDARFYQDVALTATLQHARRSWLHYRQSRRQMRWAPQSKLPYRLDFAGEQLQPGVYRLRVQVHADGFKQTLTRYVRVWRSGRVAWTTKRAYQQARRWWWGLIMVGCGLLVVVAVFRRRKRHAQVD